MQKWEIRRNNNPVAYSFNTHHHSAWDFNLGINYSNTYTCTTILITVLIYMYIQIISYINIDSLPDKISSLDVFRSQGNSVLSVSLLFYQIVKTKLETYMNCFNLQIASFLPEQTTHVNFQSFSLRKVLVFSIGQYFLQFNHV